METAANQKLSNFIYIKLPKEIAECIDGVFTNDTDPRVSWELLRSLLRKLKKEHEQLYELYMETDADE